MPGSSPPAPRPTVATVPRVPTALRPALTDYMFSRDQCRICATDDLPMSQASSVCCRPTAQGSPRPLAPNPSATPRIGHRGSHLPRSLYQSHNTMHSAHSVLSVHTVASQKGTLCAPSPWRPDKVCAALATLRRPRAAVTRLCVGRTALSIERTCVSVSAVGAVQLGAPWAAPLAGRLLPGRKSLSPSDGSRRRRADDEREALMFPHHGLARTCGQDDVPGRRAPVAGVAEPI